MVLISCGWVQLWDKVGGKRIWRWSDIALNIHTLQPLHIVPLIKKKAFPSNVSDGRNTMGAPGIHIVLPAIIIRTNGWLVSILLLLDQLSNCRILLTLILSKENLDERIQLNCHHLILSWVFISPLGDLTYTCSQSPSIICCHLSVCNEYKRHKE